MVTLRVICFTPPGTSALRWLSRPESPPLSSQPELGTIWECPLSRPVRPARSPTTNAFPHHTYLYDSIVKPPFHPLPRRLPNSPRPFKTSGERTIHH